VWLALAVVVAALVAWIWARGDEPLVGGQLDAWVLRKIASLRTDWLTPIMRGISILGSGWVVTILGWGTVILLIVFKRWRHLFTFVGSVAVTSTVFTLMFLSSGGPAHTTSRSSGTGAVGRCHRFRPACSPPVCWE
jgi:hypothetical protein